MASQWGAHGWYLIHHMLYDLKQKPNTEEMRDALTLFFTNFGKLLPCGTCRTNYANKLREMPFNVHLSNLNEMEMWAYHLHNKVNLSLKKPEFTMEQYNKMYTQNKPVEHKDKMRRFIDIIGKNNIRAGMALSQIQTMKTLLRSLVILHPQSSTKMKAELDKIKDVNNYAGLKEVWDAFYKSLL